MQSAGAFLAFPDVVLVEHVRVYGQGILFSCTVYICLEQQVDVTEDVIIFQTPFHRDVVGLLGRVLDCYFEGERIFPSPSLWGEDSALVVDGFGNVFVAGRQTTGEGNQQ